MPHDVDHKAHWHEPKADEIAGYGSFKRPKFPYDQFMESEGVPIYRGIGVHRVQDLPMAPWKRLVTFKAGMQGEKHGCACDQCGGSAGYS